jgi:hypothetical protein
MASNQREPAPPTDPLGASLGWEVAEIYGEMC